MTADASVASVVVESALPHLDREFDYLVPPSLADAVAVGSRVRVVFAGRLVSGVVTRLAAEPSTDARLSEIRSCAGLPSYTPQALDLARRVARRYGGSLWDVLRLMAPPRVAALEKREWTLVDAEASQARLAHAGMSAPVLARRAVWAALPDARRGPLPAAALVAHAAKSVACDGERSSAILVVPDARCLAACARAARDAGLVEWKAGKGGDFVVLDHDAGPTARYAAYLAAMHGLAPLVLGTRPAALQPVPRLASITVWDDASDAYADAHAPYFHARTVAAMRAQDDGCGLLLAAFAPSVDAAALVAHGFAQAVEPRRDEARAAAPHVNVIGEQDRARDGSGRHWMPSQAWKGLREAAATAPVGVLVPRAGYVTALACTRCGAWAACPACEGELVVPSPASPPTCRDCGAEHAHLHCPECTSAEFSAARQGVEAIAAQLRRMAPDVQVHLSSAATGTLPDRAVSRGIVVATPAALPAVEGGYARLVVIGADRPTPGGLDAEHLAIRWWINAAALVCPGDAGGAVAMVGDVLPRIRRAVQTWDPWGAARDAYDERRELALPPVRRAIRLEGDQRAVDAARAALRSVPEAQIAPDPAGAVVLVSRGRAQDAVDALRALVVERSRAGDTPLRMRVDAPL